MTNYVKAATIAANKADFIGEIVGLTIRGAGSQWTVLKDVEDLNDGRVKLTVKMIAHNAHMGIRTKIVNADKNLGTQKLEDFVKWANGFKIELNLD